MPTVVTLVADIQDMLSRVVSGKETVELTTEQISSFSTRIGDALVKMLQPRKRTSRTGDKTLYMSEVGQPCRRKLWYQYHTPEVGGPMAPHTLIKFLIGDITEAVMLLLARLAGHEVTGEQDKLHVEVEGWNIRGRRDALIDGTLVDVKSASKYSFEKFRNGLTPENDTFGYLTQLDLYQFADPRKSVDAGFLVMNKETGNMLYSPNTSEKSTIPLPHYLRECVKDVGSTALPPRAFKSVPEGKSGNMKLQVNCSYCAYKTTCWPGVRGFNYASGPVYLTEVSRVPDVLEFVP